MAEEKKKSVDVGVGIGSAEKIDESVDRELYNERRQIFADTIALKPAKRVPTMSNFLTWKVFDAGYKLSEACYDWDVMEKVMRHHIETYQFDVNIDNGWRNPNGMMREYGWERHIIKDENESVEVKDSALMESVEEYDEYMQDKDKMLWEKFLPRRRSGCGADQPWTKGQLYEGTLEFLKYREYLAKMNSITQNEYQIPLLCGPVVSTPYENIYGSWRGIRLTGGDLRRYPDKVMELCVYVWEHDMKPVFDGAINGDTSMFLFDTKMPMLGHSILNKKQFAKFYWPWIKEQIDVLAEKHKTTFINSEADLIRFADFLDEIPAGVSMVILELDDIFEFRKRLPNMAVAGGMTNQMLQYGTVQECVDYAKKLVDELGPGYAMSQNKLGAYRNDGKSENVKAVNEFLKDYRP